MLLLSLLLACSSAPSVSPATPSVAVSATTPALEEVSELGPAPLDLVERQLGEAGGPLIIAMHGRGDSPERFGRLLDPWSGPARLLLPRAPLPYHEGWSWFEISARSGESEALNAGILAAAAQVEALIAARSGAGERPVVLGFSQGGMLAATLAVTAPERIAGAVAIGGWLPQGLWPEQAPEAAVPLTFFHGEADEVLPLGPTKAAVQHLQGLGLPVELRTWPGVGHGISAEMHREILARVRELSER
ncbi:MAG: alpha/beta fold hydrolase [Alphaproteobacteria bacterium]|nr:alpha/beta fold hydrolase [Alphaproteobacteria bacterium]